MVIKGDGRSIDYGSYEATTLMQALYLKVRSWDVVSISSCAYNYLQPAYLDSCRAPGYKC